jgi:hypothetical protein
MFLPNSDIVEVFDIDTNCKYNDGDLVGICPDGLIRPLNTDSEIKPVEYIGVVAFQLSILVGNSDYLSLAG